MSEISEGSEFEPRPIDTAEVFARAGGLPAFEALVDAFYARVERDELLRPMYPDDLEPGKRHLALFLAQYFGGGDVYGRERGHPRLRRRHGPFPITPEAAGHWARHMTEAVHEQGHSASFIVLSNNAGSAENDPASRFVHAVLQRPVARHDLFRALQSLDLPKHATGEAAVTGPATPRKMRVLAAEDNKTNRLVFSKMMKSLEIELQFAENGQEAVDMFASFQPDIIFTDISMPEMDGTEATRRIRQIEAGSGGHVPVIAMTAHAMDGDEEGILASGIDHYLTKPLKKDAIVKHILDAWSDTLLHPLGIDQPS